MFENWTTGDTIAVAMSAIFFLWLLGHVCMEQWERKNGLLRNGETYNFFG